jgi:hypothetical protein
MNLERYLHATIVTPLKTVSEYAAFIPDRMDVSTDTLDKHYDARIESSKRELRREQFNMQESRAHSFPIITSHR